MSDDVPLLKYVDERFNATNMAIGKAEAAANRLHDVSNNIANTMMPRAEYTQAHHALEQKTDATQKLVWVGLGIAIAVQIAVGIAIVVWFHK